MSTQLIDETRSVSRRRSPASGVAGRRVALVAGALMAVASLAGLTVDGLYQDPAEVVALLRGYDVVSLLLAVPTLAVCVLALRDSVRARLVLTGVLAYTLYAYAVLVFGTSFNDLFLVHVAVLSLSVWALVLTVRDLDVDAVGDRLRPGTPARWLSGLFAFLAVGLGGMWAYYDLRFAVTGQPPEESMLVLPASGVHLAHALDLALLVPAYAVTAVLLWRRFAWGYLLAAVLLVSGTLLQVPYLVALPLQVAADVPGAVAFDPVEPVFVALFVVGAVLLLHGRGRSRRG